MYDKEFLIKNKDKPLKEVARHLRRTVQAIKDKRRNLGLKREKIIDLKGLRFGRWSVLRVDHIQNRKCYWLCECDCGIKRPVNGSHLKRGESKSCGCLNAELSSERNKKDLIGQKFAKLTVIREIGRTKFQQLKWLCKCDCGKETIAISNNLLNGNTESCGCRRTLNQQQGLAWEKLLYKFLKYKFPKFEYQKRLPNNKIPDFMAGDGKIILDTKRHDNLKIDECIKKYSPYCIKIIFICMIKNDRTWKSDLTKNVEIEFWYPEDILSWIPREKQNDFIIILKNIKSQWFDDNKERKNITIQEAITKLESTGNRINQKTVAKELGTSIYLFKEEPLLGEVIKMYNKSKLKSKEKKFLNKVKMIINTKIRKKERLSFQGIAKSFLELNNNNHLGFTNQQLWVLTKNYLLIRNPENLLKQRRKTMT